MSGSPKYSSYSLEAQRRRDLEAARQRQAEEEARVRREVARREAERRANMLRQRLLEEAETLKSELEHQSSALLVADADSLRQRTKQLIQQLKGATSEDGLMELAPTARRLEVEANRAKARKSEDDQRRISDTLERMRSGLTELERQLKAISAEQSARFDEAGRVAALSALDTLKTAVRNNNSGSGLATLKTAAAALNRHQDTVASAAAHWALQHNAAMQALSAVASILTGLGADPVVVRWCANELEGLQVEIERLNQAIAADQFEVVIATAERLKQQEQILVAQANTSQLQADQRDYVVQSIQAVLTNMGFTVGGAVEEHPGHPATAVVFVARAGNKAISVSVPVDGEVWYDAGGYAMHTESKVGGGTAATCDEAESVITEMHALIEESCGVIMSELQWEGRDPDRILVNADELPDSADSQEEGAC